MNRGDVVKAISDKEGLPATVVDQVLGSFFDTVAVGLSAGDDVNIRRFGKFEPRRRRAVVRLNPKTKIPISVPEKVSVGFVPSTNLKSRLNEPKPRRRRAPAKK